MVDQNTLTARFKSNVRLKQVKDSKKVVWVFIFFNKNEFIHASETIALVFQLFNQPSLSKHLTGDLIRKFQPIN